MKNYIQLLLIGASLVFSSCGKQFTPATQKDVQDVSETSKQSGLCVNENLILTFSSNEKGVNTLGINSTIRGSINQIPAGTSTMRYNPDRGLSPTVMGRTTMSDIDFIKSLCLKAIRTSLISFTKTIKPKSEYYDQETYYEVWACHDTCN